MRLQRFYLFLMTRHAICKPNREIIAICLVALKNLAFDALHSPVPPSPYTLAVYSSCSIIPCMPNQSIPQRSSKYEYNSDKPLSFPTSDSETDTPPSKRPVPLLVYDSFNRFLGRPVTLDDMMDCELPSLSWMHG